MVIKEIKTCFLYPRRITNDGYRGKILIGEDGLVKLAADGHGGIYEALVKNKMVDKMKELGVEWVFIGGVDNCLVKMVDPVLMGIAIDKGVTVACKSVVKANPYEKSRSILQT